MKWIIRILLILYAFSVFAASPGTNQEAAADNEEKHKFYFNSGVKCYKQGRFPEAAGYWGEIPDTSNYYDKAQKNLRIVEKKIKADPALSKMDRNVPDFVKLPRGGFVPGKISGWYPSEAVRSISLSNVADIRITCGELKVHKHIYFHESGKIDELPLYGSQDIETRVGKITCGQLNLFHNGNIRAALLHGAQRIKTSVGVFKCIDWAHFFENGAVQTITLYEPTEIFTDAGRLKAYMLEFYETGKISKLHLYDKQNIGVPGGQIEIEETISFDENGKTAYFTEATSVGENKDTVTLPNGQKVICKRISKFSKGNKGVHWAYFFYPTMIQTQVGEYKCFKAQFRKEGGFYGIYLSEPQMLEIGLGQFNVTEIRFNDKGLINRVGSKEPMTIETTGGKLKVMQMSISKGKLVRAKLYKSQDVDTPAGKLNIMGAAHFDSGTGNFRQCFLSKPQKVKTPKGMQEFRQGVFISRKGVIKQGKNKNPEITAEP